MSKGTVYKRKDGRWECRISMGKDDNGKRVFKSFYGKNREEAEYKAMIALDHSEDEYAVTDMTVRELVTELLHVTASRIKESTAANYVMKAEQHLIPAFGEIKCCMLKAKDIYAFIERKLKEGLSVRYLSDIIVLFKSVFRYASREYRIRNVLDGIVLPKKNKPEIAVMNKEQQLRLEKYLDKRPSVTSVGISISMYMGLRIGEVCALQWRDIDLEKRTLTVSKTIQRVQCRTGAKHTKNDIDGIKEMFCTAVSNSPNFDNDLADAVEFFDGEVDSYDLKGIGSDEKTEHGDTVIIHVSPKIWDIETSSGNSYKVSYYAYIANSDNPEYVGISEIQIKKDDGKEFKFGDYSMANPE